MTMTTTRLFQNGNSQAVRIPVGMAYARTDLELEIERVGDEIRIRPARHSLAGVLEKFSRFSLDVTAQERKDQEQEERETL